MKFHSSVLFVANIKKSKDFYTRLLGFTVEYDFGNNVGLSNGLSLWEIMPHHQIAQKLNTADNSNRFELYFEHDNINEIFSILKDEGVTFFHEIHEESWGQRTLRFFDPDNHLIEVGEPLEVFIRRIYTSGLTIDQVAAKTGVPADSIQLIISNE